MKKHILKFFISSAILLLDREKIVAQGIFQNLNFEMANTTPVPSGPSNPYYPYAVYVTNALPSWNVFIGNTQSSEVTYNDPSAGSTAVTLIGGSSLALDGNFSVYLQGGLTATDASIRQTGLVPSTAKSIMFKAQQFGSGSMDVYLGGQELSYSALSMTANYTVYGANISAFAGQTLLLEFSALEAQNQDNDWAIDDIVFSPTPVPEPSTWSLMACGVGLLGVFRRSKRSRALQYLRRVL